jgi:general nucleoside transport system permease protein
MSTTATSPQPGKAQPGKPASGQPAAATDIKPAATFKPVTWKLPVTLLVLGAVAFIFFGLLGPNQTARFGISSSGDFFQLPAIEVPAFLGGIVLSVLMLGLAGYALFLKTRNQQPPRWLPITFVVLFVAAFLIWVVGGARTPSISLAGLIAGSVTLAVPLVFGSLSGVLCERVGVVNIAIEGQLLGGAFTAAIVASVTHNPYVGLLAAAVAGALVSMVLAVFSIKYVVNQIIVGVVLNVLVSGLTGFLFSTVMQADPEMFNAPDRLPIVDIPVLSSIPVLGPILFKQSVVGYLMYVAVLVVWVGLFKTKWGLRVRAVGEHPQAADTMGIKVNATRFWNVTLGGAIAGIGGSFFTLVAIDSFTKEISGGRGFIALAALIFGRWNPIGAFFAALLFGFADNLQSIVTIIGTPVPSQFMAMLPYLVTVLAVAGLVGRSRPPAASGIPYVKG